MILLFYRILINSILLISPIIILFRLFKGKEDFKRFHNLDVKELDGVAIMSDTDNSKMKSIAYFQNIYFSEK